MEHVKSTLRLAKSRGMLIFVPQLLWTGTSIAYWSSFLTPVMIYQ